MIELTAKCEWEDSGESSLLTLRVVGPHTRVDHVLIATAARWDEVFEWSIYTGDGTATTPVTAPTLDAAKAAVEQALKEGAK